MEDNPSTPITPTPEAKPTPAPEPTPAPGPTPAEPAEPVKPVEPSPIEPTPDTPAEPAEPAPAEPATPAETPAAPTTTPSMDTPIKPKKKINKPLIIGASAAAAVLVGGAVAFAIYRSQPEVIAFDAVSGILSADKLSAVGDINIATEDADTYGIKSATLHIDSKTNGANNFTTATANVVASDDSNISLDFGEAFMSDGKIYIKIEGIKKALEALPSEESQQIDQYFSDIIDKIDGVWWEISVPDVLEALSDTIPEDTRNQINSVYECGVTAANEAKSNNEMVEFYSKHRFVKVENYSGSDIQAINGGNLYSLSIDTSTLADFAKEINNSTVANNFATCINNIEGLEAKIDLSESTKDIDADDFKELSENLPEVVLEINFWTHQMSGLHIRDDIEVKSSGCTTANCATETSNVVAKEEKVGTISADFKFDYKVDAISAPSDNKPVTELINIFKGTLEDLTTTQVISDNPLSTDVDTDTGADTSTDDFDDDHYDDAEDEDDFIDEEEDEWAEYDD